MKKTLLTVVLLLLAALSPARDTTGKISPRLEHALAGAAEDLRQDDGTWAVWVHFTDKGLTDGALADALISAEQQLPERTQRRRAKMKRPGQRLTDVGDLPLAAGYLDVVAAAGAQPRRQSRWLNAEQAVIVRQ